jgi:hypothetical protein
MSARTIAASGVESFAHLTAKQLLLAWLREAGEAAGCDGHADFAGLSWRVNRPGPCWAVWPEYPVLSDGTGVAPVWDELDRRWRDLPPSYGQLVASGVRPRAIVDIAVQHKGRIAFAIEVKHKNPISPPKLGFLRRQDLAVIEIPAYWVLGQVDRPERLPEEFFL